MTQPEPEMTIYVTVGVHARAGPGPDPETLPISEYNALINMKYAIPAPGRRLRATRAQGAAVRPCPAADRPGAQ